MKRLTDRDFEQLANQVVDQYFTQNVPLTDGVHKVAEELGLTPDQVNQIVWQTNAKTHLTLFEKQAEDKVVEFPLADARTIVERLYTSPEMSAMPGITGFDCDTTSDFYGDLPVDAMKMAGEDLSIIEEMSEAQAAHNQRRASYVKTAQQASLEKLAYEVEQELYSHKFTYDALTDNISYEIRKLANDPRVDQSEIIQLQQDLLSEYGDDIKPVLIDTGLDSHLDIPERTKVGFVSSNGMPLFKKYAQAKDEFDTVIRCATVLRDVKTKLSKS